MVTLTIRLLPLIMDQREEVALAARSRLGNQHKNLLRKAKFLVLPLFHRSLIRADELALALAARGYREDRPVTLPRIPVKSSADPDSGGPFRGSVFTSCF